MYVQSAVIALRRRLGGLQETENGPASERASGAKTTRTRRAMVDSGRAGVVLTLSLVWYVARRVSDINYRVQ